MADDAKVDGPADERPLIQKAVRLPNKASCSIAKYLYVRARPM